MADLKQQIRDQLGKKLTQIVRRHRDDVVGFELNRPIYDQQSGLDSLDLAEVFAWMEQAFGVDPMQLGEGSISTWEELLDRVSSNGHSTRVLSSTDDLRQNEI